MLDSGDELKKILYIVSEVVKADGDIELSTILSSANINIEQTGYDNWDGGQYFYTLYVTIDVETFVRIRDSIQKIETDLLEKFKIATRHLEREIISNILIVPIAQPKIDWAKLTGLTTKEKLLQNLDFLRNTMISVATGGQRIQDINDEYKSRYVAVDKALLKIELKNPNPYKDLWEWYGKWSSTFSHYRERRAFIAEMYSSLIQELNETQQSDIVTITVDLTDWERIERSITEIKVRQSDAKTEEQFQVVGLLCRETIITLSQAVFIYEKHPILDGKVASKTDAKRMLEAYIAVELTGSSNETLRKYAKATLDLANELAHKRTASKKDSSLCATATLSLINLIGTIEGRI